MAWKANAWLVVFHASIAQNDGNGINFLIFNEVAVFRITVETLPFIDIEVIQWKGKESLK